MIRTLVFHDVDERAKFHNDSKYPELIFLSTVLRWAVNGSAINNQDAEQIIKDNDKALASMAAFLADKIQDKTIPIYHVGTKLQLGSSEINPILLRLQSMDVSSNVQGLADKDGTYYYLGGKQLYTVIVESGPNTNNIFHKGNVWYRLVSDAPPEWKNAETAIHSSDVTDKAASVINPIGTDWRTHARTIADELFDHDTKLSTRDTLYNYSSRVMDEMQKREIHGSRGRIDNPRTIMREALQGNKWWQNKSK